MEEALNNMSPGLMQAERVFIEVLLENGHEAAVSLAAAIQHEDTNRLAVLIMKLARHFQVLITRPELRPQTIFESPRVIVATNHSFLHSVMFACFLITVFWFSPRKPYL